ASARTGRNISHSGRDVTAARRTALPKYATGKSGRAGYGSGGSLNCLEGCAPWFILLDLTFSGNCSPSSGNGKRLVRMVGRFRVWPVLRGGSAGSTPYQVPSTEYDIPSTGYEVLRSPYGV